MNCEDTTGEVTNLLQIINDSPFGVYSCDSSGYITYFNKAAAALWGRTPDAGKDRWSGSWKIYYPSGKQMPADQCPMARTLKDGSIPESECITIERPDGTFRKLKVFPRPIFNEHNLLVGAHSTLVDITRTDATESQNEEAGKAIFAPIMDSHDDAVIGKDMNGTIVSWDSGAQRMFGYTKKEVIGKLFPCLFQFPGKERKVKFLKA